MRRRLARLAAGEASPESPPWGIAAKPRWLDADVWAEGEAAADGFAVADLLDDDAGAIRDADEDSRGPRVSPLPPAAVVLVVVGVLAALVAGYFALRAPAETVPLVDFPASAGPAARQSPVAVRPGGPPSTPRPASPLVVSVVGLVVHPGLVRLPPQSRVADALRVAGGARPGADLLSLNLARPLRDGDQVVVGLAEAPGRAGLRSTIIGVDGERASPPPAAPGAGAAIDLNTATVEQLDSLPGVGPVTAKAIVEWRTAHGGFTSVDQLGEVDGIGPARLQRLRGLVTVGGR